MILVDLNVVLDVIQKREPHYGASAAVLARVVSGSVTGALPAHAVTTIHYLVGRHQPRVVADSAVDWLLRYFVIAAIGREQLLRARALGWDDFEDAVVAAGAESSGCSTIITRNVKDFTGSPVEALTPQEWLLTTGPVGRE